MISKYSILFNLIFLFKEDNNTRVLFERVLSSGGLTPHLSVEVWNRFLEFESNIGDLSSIVKVERRRSAVLQNVIFYLFILEVVFLYYFFHIFSSKNSKEKKQLNWSIVTNFSIYFHVDRLN